MKNWQRAIISLAAGVCLTFVVPTAMNAVWSYLQDEHFQVSPLALILVRILNLPAVLYCSLFTLPAGIQKGDESLYCWSVGFFLNIPYYALVVFIGWVLLNAIIKSFTRKALSHGTKFHI
ncbi:MAG TPA: hypothetical protein PLK30_12950 [Blastocatellia bacterium]|nr:hypothetical protein [Blastocatellia bacterium]